MKRGRTCLNSSILKVRDEHDGRAHLLLKIKLPLAQAQMIAEILKQSDSFSNYKTISYPRRERLNMRD